MGGDIKEVGRRGMEGWRDIEQKGWDKVERAER